MMVSVSKKSSVWCLFCIVQNLYFGCQKLQKYWYFCQNDTVLLNCTYIITIEKLSIRHGIVFVSMYFCGESKDELMIEELIAEERELQALSKQQELSEEQQSQRHRQRQRDELIDELVSLLSRFVLVMIHTDCNC